MRVQSPSYCGPFTQYINSLYYRVLFDLWVSPWLWQRQKKKYVEHPWWLISWAASKLASWQQCLCRFLAQLYSHLLLVLMLFLSVPVLHPHTYYPLDFYYFIFFFFSLTYVRVIFMSAAWHECEGRKDASRALDIPTQRYHIAIRNFESCV